MSDHIETPNASSDVPWKREGHPSRDSGFEWDDTIANKGALSERLKSDEEILKSYEEYDSHNYYKDIEERVFAEMWDYHNNGSCTPILNLILNDPLVAQFVKDSEDRYLAELVAQSVIQWLGTNVGSSFLKETYALINQRERELSDKIDEQRRRIEKEKEEKKKAHSKVRQEFLAAAREAADRLRIL